MNKVFKNIISDPSRNYYLILIFLAASLPLSVFTTSFAEILLFINWAAEGNFRDKIKLLKQRKTPLVISSIFLIHLLALLYTSDFNYAIHDLKIKLPILLLPLLIGSSASLSEKQIRTILLFFSSAVLASSIISTAIFFNIFDYEYFEFKSISIFISHIRFALMVNLAIFSLFYYGLGEGALTIRNKNFRLVLILVALWLCAFLIILKSATGIVIFVILSLFLGWKYSATIKMIAPRFIVRVLMITIPLIIASYLSNSVAKFYYREKIDFSSLELQTPGGKPYYHLKDNTWAENGHYVWVYVCEPELKEEWNKRSGFPYDGKDKRGQDLRFTLIRYMASKGLRKDAGGISELNETDIEAIENGIANHIFLNKYSIYPRVYQIIWELDNYKHGNNPSGYSVAQRLVYIRAAGYIIKRNFVIGVGTGDVQQEFNKYYDQSECQLKEKSRRRAHNQYITFFVTFGFIGFLLCVTALFLPVFLENRWGDYLFLCFGIIVFLSMLNEDTLETQTGVSFFIFFYSLLLFGRSKQIKSQEN